METNPEVEIILACAYGDVGRRLRPNGTVRDFLLGNGFAKIVEAEQPARPARLSARAAKKIADGTKSIFGS